MEKAPKDGTAVWLAVDGDPYIGYYDPAEPILNRMGQWIIQASYKRVADKPRIPDRICYGLDAKPTAWMPLPEIYPSPSPAIGERK